MKVYKQKFFTKDKLVFLIILFGLLFLWCLTLLLWTKNLEHLNQPIIYPKIKPEAISYNFNFIL